MFTYYTEEKDDYSITDHKISSKTTFVTAISEIENKGYNLKQNGI